MSRPLAQVAIALAIAAAAALPADAQARRSTRTICAKSARVVSSPHGIVVGFLSRGTIVHVFKRTANGYWADVRSAGGIAGWVHTGDFC